MPVEAAVVVPLAALAKLAAHKDELLAGVAEHPAEHQPQVRRLLPAIAGHLFQQRTLAVDHLVVREGQHEIFRVGIPHAEGELVVAVLAVDRVLRHIGDKIIHPAHIPLITEAKAAEPDGLRHHRPRGRLLRRHRYSREVGVERAVHLAQKGDRLDILLAAVLISYPLAVAARIIKIEHRGHGVDTQAVGVVAVEPVIGRRNQETPHLVASIVEDRALPVGMKTLARVLVLVERRTVKA